MAMSVAVVIKSDLRPSLSAKNPMTDLFAPYLSPICPETAPISVEPTTIDRSEGSMGSVESAATTVFSESRTHA